MHGRPPEQTSFLITRNVGAERRRSASVGIGCALAALVLYLVTCAPGVQWQDSGVHQYRVILRVVENPLGLALSHPLHHWIARFAVWALPVGNPAYAVNLVSVFGGAAGVGVLAAVVLRLSHSTVAAICAAAACGLAHIYWQMSVVAETYTLAAALMTLEWLLLYQYLRTREPLWFVAVFFINGLHVADHLLGLLTLVTYAGLFLERALRRKLAWSWLAAIAVAWMLGALPYLLIIVAHLARTGDFGATVHSALFGVGATGEGYAANVLNVSLSWRLAGEALAYLGYNFPSLALLVAFLGVGAPLRGRTRLFRVVLLAQTLIIVVFVARYTIKDQLTFYVPVCALVALWFGLGVARLLRFATLVDRRRAVVAILVVHALLPIGVYLWFPAAARSRGWLATRLPTVPFRDSYDHFLRPWKTGDHSAARFAAAALQAAGPGGWFLANTTVGYATAVYYRTHGGPPGVRVFSFDDDLNDPRGPRLTRAELARHLGENGVVVVAPFETLTEFWSDALRVERGGTFWRGVSAVPTSGPGERG
ncbi:MAG: DUF2723 domain-containing protein [Phycisphaerae bacterium]